MRLLSAKKLQIPASVIVHRWHSNYFYVIELLSWAPQLIFRFILLSKHTLFISILAIPEWLIVSSFVLNVSTVTALTKSLWLLWAVYRRLSFARVIWEDSTTFSLPTYPWNLSYARSYLSLFWAIVHVSLLLDLTISNICFEFLLGIATYLVPNFYSWSPVLSVFLSDTRWKPKWEQEQNHARLYFVRIHPKFFGFPLLLILFSNNSTCNYLPNSI